MNVCVLVNLENAACAGMSDILSLPAEEGAWLSVFVFM